MILIVLSAVKSSILFLVSVNLVAFTAEKDLGQNVSKVQVFVLMGVKEAGKAQNATEQCVW